MFESPYWWPLSLDEETDALLVDFRNRMTKTPVELDRELAKRAVDVLAAGMRQNFEDILADDRLPSFCHIFNGWGDAKWKGKRISEMFADHVKRDAAGTCALLQMHPEGDFHPWQTFGYAVMAGLPFDRPLFEGGPSLKKLAMDSRVLPRKDGDELGHLLYALAHFGGTQKTSFSLGGEVLDLSELADLALHAHDHGSFKVCRKIHLTEGLCAVAAKVPGFEHVREAAEGFLEGQLDVLFALGALLEQVFALKERGEATPEGGVIERFRDAMVIDAFFENHAYLAGHLFELASLARGLGYAISPAHCSAMAYIANSLNSLFPEVVGRAAWLICFLHFGHYRRGLSLLTMLEERGALREPSRDATLTEADRAAFTVDFDAEPLPVLTPQPSPEFLLVFNLSVAERRARERFTEAASKFDSLVTPDLKLRGAFAHFRRTAPRNFPRELHYELLDDGEKIGVEIHVEDATLRPVALRLRDLAPEFGRRFPDAHVEFDAEWQDIGRLRLCFDDRVPTDRIAGALHTLIAETRDWIGEAAEKARLAGPTSVPLP